MLAIIVAGLVIVGIAVRIGIKTTCVIQRQESSDPGTIQIQNISIND